MGKILFSPFERFSSLARILRLGIFAIATLLIVISFEKDHFSEPLAHYVHRETLKDDRLSTPTSNYYEQWGPFKPMQVMGFANTGMPGKKRCDDLKYNASVGVQGSFFLDDDTKLIAMTLDTHPAIKYPDDVINDPNLDVSDIVEKVWARLSGSSVWLPEQRVYLSVTRVIFFPSGKLGGAKMSFLRGQLFNKDWQHLDNYNLTWGDRFMVFPIVFDIPAQWEEDGELYGPEDPRIILEDNVPGAEPVVIFNMIGRQSDWKRAMYIFRPFSNYSTILTIKDIERAETEKNWAPFFIPTEEEVEIVPDKKNILSTKVQVPNEYIHFVYSFKPFQILKCHLRCGDCEIVYKQEVPQNFQTEHYEDGGSLRGGTNFVTVPLPESFGLDSKVQVYAAFPRTNIGGYCDGSFYRPEFVVMVNIAKHFHLAFASESLDFGDSILKLRPTDDRCTKGRILIPNSIASWDTRNGQDIMTVTFSVNDQTVQVARIQGLLNLILNLPQLKTLLRKDSLPKGEESDNLMGILSSWVGDDIRGCLVEAALNYVKAAEQLVHPKKDGDEAGSANKLLLKLQNEAKVKSKKGQQGDIDPLQRIDRDGIPGVEDLGEEKGDKQSYEFEDIEDIPSKDGQRMETFKESEEEKEKEPGKRNEPPTQHFRRHMYHRHKP